MFGIKPKKIQMSSHDFYRLELCSRSISREWNDMAHYTIKNSLGYKLKVGCCRRFEYRYCFIEPSEIGYNDLAEIASEVKYEKDVMCYYQGNPDLVWIRSWTGICFEYHSEMTMKRTFFAPQFDQFFSEKIIQEYRKGGHIPTEDFNLLIEDLPASHYRFPENPGFDLRIFYG